MGKPVRQLVGERFGLLLVVAPAGFAKGRALWRCVCDCGSIDVIAVGNALQQGKKSSCGCAISAMISAAKRTHGQAGGKRTRVYQCWKGINQRCGNPRNPSWRNYGGRGIKVCDEWRDSFEAFYAAVGDPPEPGLTLDRIDNDRGYEPGNVRWATRLQQANNTRERDFRGERNSHAKLTEADVLAIRASTASGGLLAQQYGVDRVTISSIRRGDTWDQVGGPISERDARFERKLTADDARFIRASSAKREVLAKLLGISLVHVDGIRAGRSWRFIT